MDGNGRWAKERHLPRTVGHLQGVKALRGVVQGALKAGIKYLTLYCFSTENWKRPKDEVDYLMGLFSGKLYGEIASYNSMGVRVVTTGDLSPLPEGAKEAISRTVKDTEKNSGIVVQLAVNYGGHDEIVRAVKRANDAGVEVTKENLRSFFDNPWIPPVDLIVRTAGEERLSGFLLWDSAYAEFVFTKKYWPDMDENDVISIMKEYNQRERRFGGIERK